MPVIGAVPGGVPHLGWPDVPWNTELFHALGPTAFAMFVVILAQSAATSRAYAARYDERVSENTDLVGLGLANVGAALSGTFVVNGSPTKTQMVDSAGGRSQLSLLVTAALVLLVLLFLTRPLAYMPEAALSAVVFLIGIDLIDIDGLRRVFAERRAEFWVAAATALMVVFVGVEQGILLAMVLSLIEHTRRGYRPRNVVLARSASGEWHPEPVASRVQALPGLIIYRFTHSMYYANAQQLTNEITGLLHGVGPRLRWLCIDASAVDDVDYTAAEALRSLRGLLEANGVRMVAAQLLLDVDEPSRRELKALLGDDAFYESLQDVVAAYQQRGSGEGASGEHAGDVERFIAARPPGGSAHGVNEAPDHGTQGGLLQTAADVFELAAIEPHPLTPGTSVDDDRMRNFLRHALPVRGALPPGFGGCRDHQSHRPMAALADRLVALPAAGLLATAIASVGQQ